MDPYYCRLVLDFWYLKNGSQNLALQINSDIKMLRLIFEHLPLSILSGFIGVWISGDIVCVAFALVTGWAIDIDHTADFGFYMYRIRRESRVAYSTHLPQDWVDCLKTGKYFQGNGKVLVPFHSWEITFFLMLGAFSSDGSTWVWTSAMISHICHLLQDHKTYATPLINYSFVYRAFKGFSYEELCK